MKTSYPVRILLFSAAAFFLFFFLLNQIPLWSSDEGRFGEIAREMLESGNFIIAHFNYVPYLDKPVLAPALTAGAYALFGVNAFATRLVPALSALLGILFLYRFAARIFDRRIAGISALLLMTTTGYVMVGRFAVIDMLMTFWITTALFAMFLAFYEKKPRLYLLAYVCMGLGAMTKGLIGFVIPGFVFLIFLTWSRNLSELKRMKIPAGIFIIAALFLPWLLAAMSKLPGFFEVFIIDQHFNRFATGSFGRQRPFWFFIPIFLGFGVPWTFFLPAAIAQQLKQPADQDRLKIQFLISWMAGILIFFSIPKSKLPYYILPALVPLALFMGHFLSRIPDRIAPLAERILRISWKAAAGFVITAAIGFNIYLFFTDEPELLLSLAAVRAASLILAGGLAASLWFQKKSLERGLLCFAATFYAGFLAAFVCMKMLSPMQSVEDEARLIESLDPAPEIISIYSSPDRFSDLPFHLKQRIVVTGPDWGTLQDQAHRIAKHDPGIRDYFIDVYDFAKQLNDKKKKIVCLTQRKWFPELLQSGLKEGNYREIYRGNDKVVITNY